jgi:two-component system phosphate regulon sensor histidine kinase PhoR
VPRSRIMRQLFPPYLFIVLLAVAGTTLYAVLVLDAFQRARTESALEALARLVAESEGPRLAARETAALDAEVKRFGRAAGVRVSVTDARGRVVGDSEAAPEALDNHADRPEVQAALRGHVGRSRRFSFTTRHATAYAAVPLRADGRVIGVVRVSQPLEGRRSLWGYSARLVLGAGAIALLVMLLSYLAWRRLALQLDAIKEGAERFARGELTSRVPVSDSMELAGIAESMNAMGAQLQERMHTVLRQRNELEAVLASMVEGVVAFDADQRVLNLNRAAAEFFGADPAQAVGRAIEEVIRNTEAQALVRQTLAGPRPVEGDITVYRRGDERTLQAHGNVLRDGHGRPIGGLLVLNNVTRLRRLETARRDFAANVSHELRTPVTAIKGCIETLQDGALDDPAGARRFLEIVHRQADRLNALIDDLLTLARVEDAAERQTLPVEKAGVRPLLESAVETCRAAAAEKALRVTLDCDRDIVVPMNATLIEQAVVNLLDNAIKYSPPDGVVEIRGTRENGEVAIHVIDHGCGIAEEHLPHLFERFYRVDKARSRKLGGTGLGLAIVKHVVRLHNGRTGVRSAPGHGSAFSIYLPLKE